jgi:hypothetical protein
LVINLENYVILALVSKQRTLTKTGELVPEPTTAGLVGMGIILLKSKGNSDRSFSKCSLFRH